MGVGNLQMDNLISSVNLIMFAALSTRKRLERRYRFNKDLKHHVDTSIFAISRRIIVTNKSKFKFIT